MPARHPSWLITAVLCSGCGAAQPGGPVPAVGAARPTSPSAPASPAQPPLGARHRVLFSTRSPNRAPSPTPRRTGALRAPPLSRGSGPRRPPIVWNPIPFGPRRQAEMTAYARRHYRSFMRPTWRLIHPRVIVIHYTEASYGSTYNTFAADTPDSELHELPGTSAHFVIATSGTIHQLVSLRKMARHTVGLNWTAIGVEHVGYSDGQVLGNRRQITSSLALVHWLRCRYGIQVRHVIGHNESLFSPYHHEDVASLRSQTHGDFVHADMQAYRRRLRVLGGC